MTNTTKPSTKQGNYTMTYLVGKKSIVTVDGNTICLKAIQEYPSLGYSSAYDWLILDQETGRITIDAQTIRLIRKDSQKRVINFVRKNLLSYHGIHEKSGAIKQLLSNYDNLIDTVKAETKKRKVDSLGIVCIKDIFPVEIIVKNSTYFM